MKKKLIIALTTIFIGTLFFGTSIMAAQYEKLYYEVVDNEVTITGCLQSAEGVVIPETIEGYPVTAIADKGFIYCRYLSSLVIPEGVRTIGKEAFYNCYLLNKITLPTTLTSIGANAFSDCIITTVNISSMDSWLNLTFGTLTSNPMHYSSNIRKPTLYLNGEPVTDVVIPEGVEEIKDYRFYNVSTLKSITIPYSVKKIGDLIFYNCSEFENVYYNGTKDEWNSITNRSSNCFAKATMHYFAYVDVLDKNGKVITNKMQDIGTSFDISSVNTPDGYKAFLFTDKEMTIPYNGEVIKTNQTLYADFLSGTKTTLSEDGKILTVESITVESGKAVILAIYDGDLFLEAKSATYQGEPLTFITDKDYTNAKVMVWDNLTNLKPVYEVETIE